MKQSITSLTIAILLVVVASPALAQDVRVNVSDRTTSTPVKVRVEVKEEMKTNVEARRASMEERKASSTERRVEMQRSLAKKKADHTSRVLTATVERLEKIILRVESRIAKIKAQGGVTAESEAFVAEAKNHLTLAKANIVLFASLDLSGEKAQENFEKVRALASETKGHIREAHTSLKNAVRALGGVRAEVERSATSTKEE